MTFEFSFANPGARSMALAGAFTALADDATAAFANPAGLVQLIEPEVSLEGRYWSYDTSYVAGGRASGGPTGEGIDTGAGIRHGTSSEDLGGVPFVSFVYPRDRWSIALYRHVWANFELRRRLDGLFGVEEGELARSEDVLSRMTFRVTNYGLAGAFEVSKQLDLGLGLVYYRAEMDAFSQEFVTTEEGFFDPEPFTPDRLDTTYIVRGATSGWRVIGGFLWHVTPRFSVGGHFRQGPALALQDTEITGPANPEAEPGTSYEARGRLELPDVYGIGAAFRSKGAALTVSFEWDRVLYGTITSGLSGTVFDVGEVELHDGDELRLGLEYVFGRAHPVVALRAGLWRDPAHRIGSGPGADVFERAIFTGGEDETHATAGVGLAFRKFQLDLGADLSDSVDLVSLSAVYRF